MREVILVINLLPSMTDRETKVFEDRLRRMADRRRLILSKSRARDPDSLLWVGVVENGPLGC